MPIGVSDVGLLFAVVDLNDAGIEALEGHGAQVRQFENVEVSDRQPRARFEVVNRRDRPVAQPALQSRIELCGVEISREDGGQLRVVAVVDELEELLLRPGSRALHP